MSLNQNDPVPARLFAGKHRLDSDPALESDAALQLCHDAAGMSDLAHDVSRPSA